MTNRVTRIQLTTSVAALAIGCLGSPAVAQHADVLAFNSAGQVGVGEFNFETFSESAKQVFPARLDSFYAVNNPGFAARPGPTALPGDTNLEWDFLPMTVDASPHDGYESTLLYWDGMGAEPIFGPTPTDDYRFSLTGKNGTAAAGVGDQLVPGYNIETTSPNGAIHEHRFFFLDDNGDGLNTTLPEAGIYLLAMQLRVAGLETSDPFFYVWATPETSVLPAIQPAAAWVNARVDTLVDDSSLLPGDFNLDGLVDAIDYAVWREGLGTTYEADDYDLWFNNYGAAATFVESPLTVPEPSALAILGLAILAPWRHGRNGSPPVEHGEQDSVVIDPIVSNGNWLRRVYGARSAGRTNAIRGIVLEAGQITPAPIPQSACYTPAALHSLRSWRPGR